MVAISSKNSRPSPPPSADEHGGFVEEVDATDGGEAAGAAELDLGEAAQDGEPPVDLGRDGSAEGDLEAIVVDEEDAVERRCRSRWPWC